MTFGLTQILVWVKLSFQDFTWYVTQSSWLGALSIVWELDLIGWSCRSPDQTEDQTEDQTDDQTGEETGEDTEEDTEAGGKCTH